MVIPRSRSMSSFIWILIMAVLGTALFAGVLGYQAGANALGGSFSPEQVQYVDGLVFGIETKTAWIDDNPNKQATSNEFRSYTSQICAGKFFPDQPVAMKGCLAALEPRPEKGYQFPR